MPGICIMSPVHTELLALYLATTVIISSATSAAVEPNNPFLFMLRSTMVNPVTYLHSTIVNQLTALPCYYMDDGEHFGASNETDMAWYRRLESTHHPRTFPSMTDSTGRLLILEPLIGYNWFLCDTAYTSKLRHARRYEQFYKEFTSGRLNMDWNYYQKYSEFDKGQFKHHVFAKELSVTEIFVFMDATFRRISANTVFDMTELTEPLRMGIFKLSLLRILEAECRDVPAQFCEYPTVDTIIPNFDESGFITFRVKIKLYLSNEKLLKLGTGLLRANRENAIKRNMVRWDIKGQSVDLGTLGTLNPFPLTLALIITAKALTKSDCIGSGSYLSVKYDWECVMCRPGYHLKNNPWVHPTSEKNSICHLCPVGTYSNRWGSIECAPCPGMHTTRKVGSTRQADCLSLPKFELETRIGELLDYFTVDESDDYKKAIMLAIMFLAPWMLFILCMLVSMAYGHNEVKDSESRFQLEKELGLIILKIRRNYGALVEDSMQL